MRRYLSFTAKFWIFWIFVSCVFICGVLRFRTTMSRLVSARISLLTSSHGSSTAMRATLARPVARFSTASHMNRVVTTVDPDTGIAHVVLNRPEKLNALDLPMFHAIRDAATTLMNDSKVRVVIIRANGRAFCTGLDVPSFVTSGKPVQSFQEMLERKPVTLPNPETDMTENTADAPTSTLDATAPVYDANDTEVQPDDIMTAVAETSNLVQDVGYLWRQVPVPVICCLHGMCFGGGLQIALGADIRLATRDCKLSIMESKWGLIPDMSATVTLRELLRIDVAKELTFTGRIVTGTEALALGLVTQCVDVDSNDSGTRDSVSTVAADAVLQHAMTLAKAMAQRNPDGLRLTKQLYQSTWVSASEEYCLQIETKLQKRLLLTWNQLAAAGRNYGWKLPYFTQNSKITNDPTQIL